MTNSPPWRTFVGMTLLVVLTGVIWAIPNSMRFQGRLTDSQGRPIVGTPQVRFEIFNAATNGSRIWGPTSYLSVNSNEAGLFSVDIDMGPAAGSIFGSAGDRFLQVTVKAGTGGQDQVLLPRQHLSNVPYAFYSQLASSAAVASLANTVPDNSISNSKIQNNAVTSSKILDRSVLSIDIATKAIISSHIADEAVKATHIEDETITPSKMDIASFTTAGWIIPKGAIFMFLTACPDGFSEVTELQNRYPLGADTQQVDPSMPDAPGVSTGAKTHSHNHSHTIEKPGGWGGPAAQNDFSGYEEHIGGGGWHAYSKPMLAESLYESNGIYVGLKLYEHKHKMSEDKTSTTLLPPSLSVVFCQKNN